MRTFGLSFLSALLVLAVLDGIWLGFIGRDFYKARLGPLMREDPVWLAAVLFYLLHAAGIATFAVPAALGAGTWLAAACYGALYGLFVYAAYDLTNQAVLRGWSTTLTVVDMGWGALVTATATLVAFLMVHR
ncbi:DUF2177 family protein [Reyranella sp.]|uniref:DUF2177 family protein n=1 Tax=Reyranella sp. TaxID=1929291 RepID=UPI003BA86672